MKAMSVRDARSNLAELIERVSSTGETVLITKSGKPKVLILPYQEDAIQDRQSVLSETSGMWKNYTMEKRKQSRHEKIFD